MICPTYNVCKYPVEGLGVHGDVDVEGEGGVEDPQNWDQERLTTK